MKEIKVAENKTLKLTNVLSREIHPEEMASLPVVLTQMHNFIKSNNAQPIGPIVQAMAVWMRCSVRVSTLLVASSKIRMRLSARMVRAMVSSCFCP